MEGEKQSRYGDTGDENPSGNGNRRTPRKYFKPSEGGLGLPGSQYDTLVTIIRAMYHHARDTPASLDDIAAPTTLNRTVISQNNKFLLSLGIVDKIRRGFILTKKGSALGLALDYENPEEIAEAWRNIVSESDFLQKILSAIDIKGGMKANSLAAHISKSAGFPHKRKYIRGANAVIDVLLASSLLAKMEDGQINVTPEYSQMRLGVRKPVKVDRVEKIQIEDEVAARIVKGSNDLRANFVVNVNIQISAETTDVEIEEIAKRIRRLTRSVSDE